MQACEQDHTELHELIKRKEESPVFRAIVGMVKETPSIRTADSIQKMIKLSFMIGSNLEVLKSQASSMPESNEQDLTLESCKVLEDLLFLLKDELSSYEGGAK